MLIKSKYSGNCRDCGTRFAEGSQVEWQRGRGASCCSITAPEAPQVEQPVIVDGAQQMEYRTGKTTQEVVDISGDSLVYAEREYSGYNWMCLECRLVWDRQHQAISCTRRGHVTRFDETYGGTIWDGRGMMPAGGLERGKYVPGTGTTYTRQAVRREPSPDGRHRLPVAYLPYGGTTEGRNPEWEPANYPQVDPREKIDQDMTSEEMWDALTGTVTTTWN